jgi:hypothetical protein
MTLRSLLARLVRPPSWRSLHWGHLLLLIWSGATIFISTEKPTFVIPAVVFGSSLATLIHIRALKRSYAAWDELHDAYRKALEFNSALLHEKVAIHVAKIEIGGDKPKPPTQH